MIKRISMGVVIAVVAGYAASPYYAVYALHRALREADAAQLAERIDFPALRASVKEELDARLLRETANPQGFPDRVFGKIAAALGPKIVDYVVESYVTPAGIAELAVKARKEPEDRKDEGTSFRNPVRSIEKRKIRHAFFRSPTTFLVTYENIGLTFRFEHWGWKVTQATFSKAGPDGERE